jgi:hypothetical protein
MRLCSAILPACFLFIITLIVTAFLKPAPETPMSSNHSNGHGGYGTSSDSTNLLADGRSNSSDDTVASPESIDLGYHSNATTTASAPSSISVTTVVVIPASPSEPSSNGKEVKVEKPGLRFWQAIRMEVQSYTCGYLLS